MHAAHARGRAHLAGDALGEPGCQVRQLPLVQAPRQRGQIERHGVRQALEDASQHPRLPVAILLEPDKKSARSSLETWQLKSAFCLDKPNLQNNVARSARIYGCRSCTGLSGCFAHALRRMCEPGRS